MICTSADHGNAMMTSSTICAANIIWQWHQDPPVSRYRPKSAFCRRRRCRGRRQSSEAIGPFARAACASARWPSDDHVTRKDALLSQISRHTRDARRRKSDRPAAGAGSKASNPESRKRAGDLQRKCCSEKKQEGRRRSNDDFIQIGERLHNGLQLIQTRKMHQQMAQNTYKADGGQIEPDDHRSTRPQTLSTRWRRPQPE